MTEDMETTTAETAPEVVVTAATPVAAPVLMVRDPEKVPGMGMCKALVPAGEVENYKAAGWTVAEE